ncbi:MAG: D-glycerate dehydrogenase [Sphingobacteriales bacterium 40-81]|nr:MAG: D-glycerate dehydrogenase [Sphingobacteriales bacterium 40-81]
MKVYISRIIPKEGIEILQNAGLEITQYSGKTEIPSTELIAICNKHDLFLSVGNNTIDRTFLEACKHLKGIALMSVGYDRVDIAAATALGIPISNTPDVLSKATSDTAFLLILAVSRNAFYMHDSISKKQWGFFEPTANLGIELYNKTLGIFGLGRIGLELAMKCKAAYNMPVIYHNRKPNKEAEKILGAKYVSFDELLTESDVISVHANLSDQTREIFNKDAFSKMKHSAIFINTARGGLHNEQDLTEALEHKKIWGAGLDVTNPEPMAWDNPLLNMRNVCVLPHIGSATIETRAKMAITAADNIVAAMQGKPMPQVIDKQVYSIRK